MDRGRRAEPYSNATIWTREVARNLAGHLARISKAHSCVDTKSPKSRLLPKFQHPHATKRCATSPSKLRQQRIEAALDCSVKTNDDNTLEEPEDQGDNVDNHSDEAHRMRSDDSIAHTDGTTRDTHVLQPLRHPRKAGLKSRSRHDSTKKPKIATDRLDAITHENQRMHERLAKIASPNAKLHPHPLPRPSSSSPGFGSADDSMRESYDQAQLKPAHDYNKKQEQLKIWTENQALAKRLRTAKPTLKPKEWEKDDKWNQQFLKTQEKRRLALQQEMLKATLSPQSLLARAPRHLHPHDAHHSNGAAGSRGASPSKRAATQAGECAGTNSSTALQASGDSDSARASAANHRRIMQLRNQRSTPSSDSHSAITQMLGNQDDTHADDALTEHERSSECLGGGGATAEMDARPLTIDPAACNVRSDDADNELTLGEFSPALDLESALEAMTMLSEPNELVAAMAAEEESTVVDISGADASEQSETSIDIEINAVVFDTLQDSIDQIAETSTDSLAQVDTAPSAQPEPAEPAATLTADRTDRESQKAVLFVAHMESEVPCEAPDSAVAVEMNVLATDVHAGDDAQQHHDADVSVKTAATESELPLALEIAPDHERIRTNSRMDDATEEEENLQHDGSASIDGDSSVEPDASEPVLMTTTPVDSQLVAPTGDVDSSSPTPHDEPEYDDDGFDDDAGRMDADASASAETNEVLTSNSPGETHEPAALAADDNDGEEESGYGSEFDDDLEQTKQQQVEERATSAHVDEYDAESRAEVVEPSGDLGDDDDAYEDQYDDDLDDSDAKTTREALAEQQDSNNDEAEGTGAYSDDDFSDGGYGDDE